MSATTTVPLFTNAAQILATPLTGNSAVDRQVLYGAVDFILDSAHPATERLRVILHFFARAVRAAYGV